MKSESKRGIATDSPFRVLIVVCERAELRLIQPTEQLEQP
jgi:hypothetical protein